MTVILNRDPGRSDGIGAFYETIKKNRVKKINTNFSIVIPTYNSSKLLDRCLKSISKISSSDYECIVVDDGSTDDTEEIVKKYAIRYFKQENQGPAAARNKGIKEAHGKVVLFTDSDCVVPVDIIEKYREHFKSSEFAGVGGTYKTYNTDSAAARFAGIEIAYRHSMQGQDARALGSYNSAFKKKVLINLGGFDESFPSASGEDFDLCYRIIKQGYKLKFDNRIFVSHEHPSTILKYLAQQYKRGKSRIQNVFRNRYIAVSDGYVEKGAQFQPFLILLCFLGLIFGILNSIFFVLIPVALTVLFFINRSLLQFIKRNDSSLIPLALLLVILRPITWGVGATVAIWKAFGIILSSKKIQGI